jgi:hypothetical protein
MPKGGLDNDACSCSHRFPRCRDRRIVNADPVDANLLATG